MCLPLLRFPRCGRLVLANSMWESFHKSGSFSYKFLCSDNFDQKRTLATIRTIDSKPGRIKESSVKETSITHKIIPEIVVSEPNAYKLESPKVGKTRKISMRSKFTSESTKTELNASSKLVVNDEKSDEYCAHLAKLATVICFDTETTGFVRDRDRIVEIACQDLRGGVNSTFQTVVNPERLVPNGHIHGISTQMVKRSGVPRMKDLIPVFTQYVRSRQVPGGVVILISHNARAFDVPFLKNEFSRCSCDIPSDWLFADTLPLARAVMKSKGDKVLSKLSLQALRAHYGIPLIGSAHRALSDVHTLALVLQRLTHDLKLPISGLIQESFK